MAKKRKQPEPTLEMVAQHEIALMERLRGAESEESSILETARTEARRLEEAADTAIHEMWITGRKEAAKTAEEEYEAILEARREVMREEETYARRRLEWAIQDVLALFVPPQGKKDPA